MEWKSLVQFGNGSGLKQQSYGLRVGNRRIVYRKMSFNGDVTRKFDILEIPDSIPDKIKNLPNYYLVCTSGCDTFTDGELVVPCGRCGAPMKRKDKVYD